MKIKFTFWRISYKGQTLNYKFTYKGARKWMKKWMEANLNKGYNGLDKVQIEECIVNDECKSPRLTVSFTYFYTEK